MTLPIPAFYKDKNVFLTGGTGFMGTVTVEKLLRSFPEIGSIYMLVRPKKGITVEERKNMYFNNIIFDRLKSEQDIKKFSKKLHWIEGDITRKNLGISEKNIGKLQNEINLIIHGAAELRFTLPLKCYVESNIRATYDLLKIADGCKELRGFLYVSSAFSQINPKTDIATETIIKPSILPLDLIKMADKMSTERLETKSNEILQDSFNGYIFSKNCAENLYPDFEGRFPIVIYRPAVVGHSYSEPYPYYIGNNFALPKVLMEAHRGFVLFCNPECDAITVPVDFTVNGMLAAMGQLGQNSTKKLKVYNYTTQNNPCGMLDAFRYYSNSIPDYESILVPHRYKLMAMKEATPGSSKDKELQNIRQFDKFFKTVKFGTLQKFSFINDNIDHVWKNMSEEEKTLLPFDIRACNWKKYYSNMAAKQFGIELPKFEHL